MHQMGVVLCSGVSDSAAGIALLEEVVAGRTAVLGEDHRDTRETQRCLGSAKNKDNSEEEQQGDDDHDDGGEEEEEEETIADRIRKRRRLSTM